MWIIPPALGADAAAADAADWAILVCEGSWRRKSLNAGLAVLDRTKVSGSVPGLTVVGISRGVDARDVVAIASVPLGASGADEGAGGYHQPVARSSVYPSPDQYRYVSMSKTLGS